MRPDGTRRLYAVRDDGLREVDAWLDTFRRFWAPRLDALSTEIPRRPDPAPPPTPAP